MKKQLLLLLLITVNYASFAQDYKFSQFFASPLNFNPAFAGTNNAARIGLNYRNQNPELPNQAVYEDLEYDQYVNALHGGLGVMLLKNDNGSGTLKTTNISGIYSYQLNVSKDFTISAGDQVSYMQENLDWSKNFTPYVIYLPEEIQNATLINYLDLSAGVLGYTDKFYGGVAVSHLSQPDINFTSEPIPLAMKVTGNFGAMIPDDNLNKKSYISPNFIFVIQQHFAQYNTGIEAGRGPFVCAVWYRTTSTNDNAYIGLIGLSLKRIKIGFSFDIPSSHFSNADYATQELSLTYLFNCHKNNLMHNHINCPSF
jgi:type IX secretion system PorP/SprF family membrane protein